MKKSFLGLASALFLLNPSTAVSANPLPPPTTLPIPLPALSDPPKIDFTIVKSHQTEQDEANKAAQEAAILAQQQAQLKAKTIQYEPQVHSVAPSPSQSQTDPKTFIYTHESGNNPAAINSSSGACGLGQALPCSKLPCSLSDYACEDAWFSAYALRTYGSWEQAYQFWLVHHWW